VDQLVACEAAALVVRAGLGVVNVVKAGEGVESADDTQGGAVACCCEGTWEG